MNMLEQVNEEKTSRFRLPFRAPSKPVIIGVCVVVGILLIVFAAAGAVRLSYKDRILSGVHYANLDLGGLDRLAATELLQKTVDAMLDKGLAAIAGGNTADIALRTESTDFSYDLMDIDITGAVNQALAVGKGQNPIGLLKGLILATVGQSTITPDITLNDEQLENALRTAFIDLEDAGEPTDFVIKKENGAFSVAVEEGTNGKTLDIRSGLAALHKDAEDLSLATLRIDVETVPPTVTGAEAETLVADVQQVLSAPLTLTYTAENAKMAQTWDITTENLMAWLAPKKGTDPERANYNQAYVSLDQGAMADFFAVLHDAIDIKSQDARFAMEGNHVVEFAGSHSGVTVNEAATVDSLASYFAVNEGGPILVVVDLVQPAVTTANVNNLGITEALGVGTSVYKGSPSNRIANIAHGADKLNGMLIAPGETVSLVDKLGPFTVADGYLPELVIKGDEIKPEIGGGLCQIGTTTFRAVMNSGLKVVERRNHSLVVSYYNDPGNGNPGTDATIYDPAPDFKFMNDTGNYILLATENDTTNQQLNFTFWGTNDGREASYTPPTVLSWSGYGATVNKETDTLAPGVTKCQAPHPGATTTFTYTVAYADGTKHEEEFFSSYRSLAKICLVGKSDTPAPVEAETTSATDPAVPVETTVVEE